MVALSLCTDIEAKCMIVTYTDPGFPCSQLLESKGLSLKVQSPFSSVLPWMLCNKTSELREKKTVKKNDRNFLILLVPILWLLICVNFKVLILQCYFGKLRDEVFVETEVFFSLGWWYQIAYGLKFLSSARQSYLVRYKSSKYT